METKQKIFESLKTVIDPEIGMNIVDLGLVYDLILTDNSIIVNMTLTTPGCPMHNSITSWVENVIQYQYPDKHAVVNLIWEPRWSPDKMSDYAREQLGF